MESAKSMLPLAGSGKMADSDITTFRQSLLAWYDRHRRVLPWRAGKGRRADPYHVWLSEIMLQQTVVAAVIPYFQKFVEKWPTVHDLAAAKDDELMEAWAGLGYYARARNLLKCARIVSAEHGGRFPDNQDDLKGLPGIGDYTSAAITAIAFDKPATVIDGNVDRVTARYFALTAPLPGVKPEIRQQAEMLSGGRKDRPGDFAQAMMDLGATICIPKAPRCVLCPLQTGCAGRQQGIQAELPYKKQKAAKPKRYGYIYWVKNDRGEVLVERRDANGLLGGMPGFPTSEWLVDRARLSHPDFISPKATRVKVLHTFTHFDLELEGYEAVIGRKAVNGNCQWLDDKGLRELGLPTVFKKFARLMLRKSNETIIV